MELLLGFEWKLRARRQYGSIPASPRWTALVCFVSSYALNGAPNRKVWLRSGDSALGLALSRCGNRLRHRSSHDDYGSRSARSDFDRSAQFTKTLAHSCYANAYLSRTFQQPLQPLFRYSLSIVRNFQ